ncbi:MAG: ABC transporter permease [Pseudobdellovibrio sp.]
MIWIPLLWYLIFFFGPLIFVLALSFLKRGMYGGIEWEFTLGNFLRLFDSDILSIVLRSLALASTATFLCLVVAVPLTWKIVTLPEKRRHLAMFFVSIPFFMNSLVRIYSIKMWFLLDGPVDQLLNSLAIQHDIFNWSQNGFLVYFAIVITYLPFMIFPLYGAFDKFDFSLIEAAQDLGAGTAKILFNIIMPVLKKAILSGCLLVFIPCLGEFLIPDLLGGAKTMLLGNLITELYLKSRDWPQGSAVTAAMLFYLVLLLWLSKKIKRPA